MRNKILKYSLTLVGYLWFCSILLLGFLETQATDRKEEIPYWTFPTAEATSVPDFTTRQRAGSVQEKTVGPLCIEADIKSPGGRGRIKVLSEQVEQSSPKKNKAANGTPTSPNAAFSTSGGSSSYSTQSTRQSDLRSTIVGDPEDAAVAPSAASSSSSPGLHPLIAELYEKGLEDTRNLESLLEAASEILGLPWDFGASLRAPAENAEEKDDVKSEGTIRSFDRYWEILIENFRDRPDLTFSQFREELTGHPVWQAAKCQIEGEVLGFVDHLRFPEKRHHAYTKEELLDDLVNDLRLFMERVYARQQMLKGREWGLTFPFFYTTPKKTIFVGRREAFIKLDFDRLKEKLRNKGSLDAEDTWQLGSVYEDGGIIPYGRVEAWLDKSPEAAEELYVNALRRYYNLDIESDTFTEEKDILDTDYTNSLLVNLARLYQGRPDKKDLRQRLLKTAEKEGDLLAQIILADEGSK